MAEDLWNACRGKLSGCLLPETSGREVSPKAQVMWLYCLEYWQVHEKLQCYVDRVNAIDLFGLLGSHVRL